MFTSRPYLHRAGRPAPSTTYLKLAAVCLLLAGAMYVFADEGQALLATALAVLR